MLEIAGILRDSPGEVCDADSLHHDIADGRIGAQFAARNRCQDRLFDVGRKLAGKSLECFGGIVANDVIVIAHPGDEAPWPAAEPASIEPRVPLPIEFLCRLDLLLERHLVIAPDLSEFGEGRVDVVLQNLFQQLLFVAEVVMNVSAGDAEDGGYVAEAHTAITMADKKLRRRCLDPDTHGELCRAPGWIGRWCLSC